MGERRFKEAKSDAYAAIALNGLQAAQTTHYIFRAGEWKLSPHDRGRPPLRARHDRARLRLRAPFGRSFRLMSLHLY